METENTQATDGLADMPLARSDVEVSGGAYGAMWVPQPFPRGVPENTRMAFQVLQDWSRHFRAYAEAVRKDLENRADTDKVAEHELHKFPRNASHIPDPPGEIFADEPITT